MSHTTAATTARNIINNKVSQQGVTILLHVVCYQVVVVVVTGQPTAIISVYKTTTMITVREYRVSSSIIDALVQWFVEGEYWNYSGALGAIIGQRGWPLPAATYNPSPHTTTMKHTHTIEGAHGPRGNVHPCMCLWHLCFFGVVVVILSYFLFLLLLLLCVTVHESCHLWVNWSAVLYIWCCVLYVCLSATSISSSGCAWPAHGNDDDEIWCLCLPQRHTAVPVMINDLNIAYVFTSCLDSCVCRKRRDARWIVAQWDCFVVSFAYFAIW